MKIKRIIFFLSFLTVLSVFFGMGQSPFMLSDTTAGNNGSGPAEKENLLPKDIQSISCLSQDDLNVRIKALQSRLSAQQGTDAAGIAINGGNGTAGTSLLPGEQSLEGIYLNLIAAMNKTDALEKDMDILVQKDAGPDSKPSEPPPYSIFLYDRKKSELLTSEQKLSGVKDEIEIVRQLVLDHGRNILKKYDVTGSQPVNGKGTSAGANATADGNAVGRIGDDLAKESAYAQICLEKKNLENLFVEQRLETLRQTVLVRELSLIRRNISFTHSDIKNITSGLEARRADLNSQLAKILSEQKWIEAAWEQAVTDRKYTQNQAAADAFVQARDAWRKTYQSVQEMIGDSLRIFDYNAQIWQNRFLLINGTVSRKLLIAWTRKAKTHLAGLDRQIMVQQGMQNSLGQQLAAMDTRTGDPKLNPEVLQHLQTQVSALNRLSQRRAQYIVTLLESRQLDQQFMDGIDRLLSGQGIWEQISYFWGRFTSVWSYEIWVVDGNSVTLKQLLLALLCLTGGVILSKIFVSTLAKRLVSRYNFQETTVTTIKKVVLYFAYLLVVLFSLRIVNIPLAAFAFLGGAVAIGVGFGAQNLINNFISGFILMGERPIRINDLIEIDGVLGRVEDIGGRCTRIRSGDNIHILVPNSSFLEKNITNWTLSDLMIRTRVSVGVAYGSPGRTVEQLLLQVVDKSNGALKQPKPYVLFKDFGDNSLVFDLVFWLLAKTVVDRQRIESDIRFEIDALFKEAGIVIAFPQRDVHIDTTTPLRLEITKTPS